MSNDTVSGNVNGDLVSREWVLKEIRAHKAYAQSFRQVTYATGYMCGLSVLEGRLADAPAVDAAPVVHGTWLEQRVFRPFYGKCSECGAINEKDKFCPNCGAKMDKEAN